MDKGIQLIKKVKADINDLVDIILSEKNAGVREQAESLLQQNKAWLAEWDLQNICRNIWCSAVIQHEQ